MGIYAKADKGESDDHGRGEPDAADKQVRSCSEITQAHLCTGDGDGRSGPTVERRITKFQGVELIINKDKKKHTGTLYPACRLKMNKQNELELELYQNPWKLVNIMKR